jgi:hypothetical protein
MGKRLFVEQRPEGDYAVRRPNSKRASAVADTHSRAIAIAREITRGNRRMLSVCLIPPEESQTNGVRPHCRSSLSRHSSEIAHLNFDEKVQFAGQFPVDAISASEELRKLLPNEEDSGRITLHGDEVVLHLCDVRIIFAH